jgi:glycosyltransferase involved in cell wall biosynthesis
MAAKYGVSETYICAVGTIEPRKNLSTLAGSVAFLGKRARFPFQLVIAGGEGWRNSGLHRSVLRAGLSEGNVKFLGFVPEEDLPLLYSGASAFVFPSLHEGFGLPLVEAMACGVPIVASNVSSIPEVVLDAGLLVPPQAPEAFADAIFRVTNDCDLRSRLITKGIERSRLFRWDKAAREVLQVFNQLCQH